MTSTSPRETTTEPDAARSLRLFSTLIAVAALAVLLQGLWAGIFLEHDGERDAAEKWINVHARGGEVALALAALATLVAFLKLRQRRDLWIGSAALTALIVLESYLGGMIVDQSKDTLTAVHVPLAMALMGLVVWLPFRATRRAPDGPRRVATIPGQPTKNKSGQPTDPSRGTPSRS